MKRECSRKCPTGKSGLIGPSHWDKYRDLPRKTPALAQFRCHSQKTAAAPRRKNRTIPAMTPRFTFVVDRWTFTSGIPLLSLSIAMCAAWTAESPAGVGPNFAVAWAMACQVVARRLPHLCPPSLKLRRAAFVLAPLGEGWWTLPGSNRGPPVCDTGALTN